MNDKEQLEYAGKYWSKVFDALGLMNKPNHKPASVKECNGCGELVGLEDYNKDNGYCYRCEQMEP